MEGFEQISGQSTARNTNQVPGCVVGAVTRNGKLDLKTTEISAEPVLHRTTTIHSCLWL